MTTTLLDPAAGPAPGVGLDDLDAGATLAAAEAATRARRSAEVEDLLVVAHWADLHSDLPVHDPGVPAHARERMIQPGGDGTPALREYALVELAWARQTHHATTRAALADILDLRHRLPGTHAVLLALGCEPWLARKVAVICRHLDAEKVGIVDRAVAPVIGAESPAVVLELARATTIEADPEHEAAKREYERRRRYVALSRSDETGYRTVIARVSTGDAVWVDAMVDRVADILAIGHGHDHNRDELRALAFGWLARPADLLKLLLEHTTPEDPDPEAPDPTQDSDPVPEPTQDPDAQDPGPEPTAPPRPAWAPDHLRDTIDRLASMRSRQLAALRPRATVHVHLSEAALRAQSGLARVEELGPILVQHLAELLGHADVTLQPVRDLTGRIRLDQYQIPDAVKDHTWQLTGGDVFPYAPRGIRAVVDYDHPRPWQPDGPPGQTGTHNSGPLRRRHHRWKTFGGYRCRQAGPGRYLWATPHGRYYLRDHTGTHPLHPDDALLILEAPPGVDIHLGPELVYQPSG